MQLEITDSTMGLHHAPVTSIRWTAILAGLVVGIATNLLLMLLGAAIGLAAVDVGETAGEGTIPIAAGIWNTVSMIVAAFVGAYVAARSAGMRRNSDGILHGVVSWGLTMLVTAFLATTIAGAALGTFFGSPAARSAASQAAPVAPEVARSLSEGDRQEAISILRDRFGISNEQATRVVDQALIVSGREEQASPAAQESAQQTVDTAALASGWLTGAILLSLLAAVGGGWLGARGTHRVVKPQLHQHELRQQEVVTDPATGRTVRTE